eukprot:EG_transcript_39948
MSSHQLPSDTGWGVEVSPSIFMRDNRGEPAVNAGHRQMDPRLIPDEIKRLRRVIEKLEESNGELHEALKEDPGEREYRLAIEENILVIARTKETIQFLEKRVPCKCGPSHAGDEGMSNDALML